MRIPSGVTDQYIYFVAMNGGSRVTGLSSFTVYRSRDGAAAVAYTTPTVNETDSVNMPGVYELLLDEDMTIGAGNDSEEVCLHISKTGMDSVTRTFELYRREVTAGETLLVASGIADADVEKWLGTAVNATAAGYPAVDVNRVSNSTVTATVLSRWLSQGANGTADSGTTTTLTDTTLSLTDASGYVGSLLIISSGTNAGYARRITSFNPATDTITVTPAFPAAIDATSVFAIVPDGSPEAIAAAVWDRVLSGATHNIASSAGRRLRQLDATSITDGTAQAGATNSITLAAGASSTNDIYDENLIVITEGTGAGQTRVIVEYNGTTKVAIVNRLWEVTPNATSVYEIIAGAQADIAQHGLAQAGTASTITLSSAASATDDIYIGAHIYLSTSNGAGQTRLITDYVGATKVATVSPDWVTNPGATTVYKIIPIGRSIVGGMSSDVTSAIADALLDRSNGIETGYTLRQTARLMAAVLLGKLSGGGTVTEVFRDINDTKDRVTATVDTSGNRTVVTKDAT